MLLENIFGLLAAVHFFGLFVVALLGAAIYRLIVRPYLGLKDMPPWAQAKQYREMCIAKRGLGLEGSLWAAPVSMTRKFSKFSSRHFCFVCFGWIGLFGIGLLCSIIGI
jgi:hypothetical protein